ncbi:MAG TPA: DUF5916 domain-containing protein [Myxococcaceae bacterium]|nr:DUF5916 domain-containing protein [Myxococcaceae bacterium]
MARLTRRDRDVGSDSVQVDLDSRGDHREAFHFEVSAAGVQRDAIRTGDQALNFDWDAVWTSAVRVDAEGWTVELAIPLTVLRFKEHAEADWRIQARRLIARPNELDAIAFIPRAEHGELSRYLAIDGLAGLPAPRGLELVPFALAQLRQRGTPAVLDWAPGVGLDARYGLTAGLSLDGTVLPDFAQVEADQAVLNLTTFEVQFPEKRPFFLEGAELFSLQDVFGDPLSTQLFYSRRLGAPAPEVEAPDGFTVASAPARIGLWGAVKVAGKVNDALSLALVDGVTAAERAKLIDPAGDEVLEGIAAPSNFFAGRAQLELPAGWRAGLTLSDARRAEGASSLGLAGICLDGAAAGADGRCTHDATALQEQERIARGEGKPVCAEGAHGRDSSGTTARRRGTDRGCGGRGRVAGRR